MARGKTILIAGGSDMSAAISLQLKKLGDVEIVTPDQAKERGIEPLGLSFQQRIEDFISTKPLEITITDFNPPMTRRERRKQEREKKKH